MSSRRAPATTAASQGTRPSWRLVFLLGILSGAVLGSIITIAHPRQLFLRARRQVWLAIQPTYSPAVLSGKRTLVLLAMGQSNAGNNGGVAHAAPPETYVWYRSALRAAAEPIPGADGDWGNVWTRLADTLIRRHVYDAVVIAMVEQGGTTLVDDWAAGTALDHRLSDLARDLLQHGLPPTAILWVQGESDAEANTRGDVYESALRGLVVRIRANRLGAPIYLARSTRCRDAMPNEGIRNADSLVAAFTPGVVLGPDTDDITGQGRQPDRCHFSEDGLEQVAGRWAAILAPASTARSAAMTAPAGR